MQDRRRQFDEIFLQRAAGPYMVTSVDCSAAPSTAGPLPAPEMPTIVWQGDSGKKNAR
jgi:hypothetical protein